MKKASVKAGADPTPLPATVAGAGTRSAVLLDVRPVLEAGGEPFSLIMKTTGALPEDAALHLVAPFEPVPLYEILSRIGRTHHTEQRGAEFHVWFYRASTQALAMGSSEERAPLLPPVEMDVSGMEPPNPMITILQKLVELGPGAQLSVRHHREPVLLYDKLAARGYAARCEKKQDGQYLIHIAPQWAIAEEAHRDGARR